MRSFLIILRECRRRAGAGGPAVRRMRPRAPAQPLYQHPTRLIGAPSFFACARLLQPARLRHEATFNYPTVPPALAVTFLAPCVLCSMGCSSFICARSACAVTYVLKFKYPHFRSQPGNSGGRQGRQAGQGRRAPGGCKRGSTQGQQGMQKWCAGVAGTVQKGVKV